MISYFIVALHVYKKLFEQTYKSQFQVIFGQDSFPPKISQFQVGQSFAELYKLSPCEWMRKFKFKMKTSSRNITKLWAALQNMYSAELLQISASSIVIIPLFQTVGCLERSKKITFIMWLKLQKQSLKIRFIMWFKF